MSCPSTPLQSSPSKVQEVRTVEAESPQLRFKSPQVVFADQSACTGSKHNRSTPESGRGKLKRIKEDLAVKLANRRFYTASPSHILTKSMLSFDLAPTSRLGNEDDVVGENELFVKFVSDRRNSSGRGTLQRLINKRIAYQVGSQAVAQRQAASNPPPVPDGNESTEVKKHVKPRKLDPKPVKPIKMPVPHPVTTRHSEASELEIPLGQQDVSKRNSVEEPAMSQTQVFQHEMSQTQVLDKTQPLTPAPMTEPKVDDIPFLGTPFPVVGSLEPVLEESDESESDSDIREREERKRMMHRFIDAEADESDSEGGVRKNSDDESESSGDLSDLIASEDEDDENADSHARLHNKWIQEQEDSFHPFRRKGDEESYGGPKERRKNKIKAFRDVLQKPAVKAVKSKRKPVDVMPSVEKPAPPPKPKQPWIRRNPHRKSSVSSCTDIEINVRSTALRSRAPGQFSFINAPSKHALERIAEKDEARAVAEAKAAAGSRLMGAKRFVFGNS